MCRVCDKLSGVVRKRRRKSRPKSEGAEYYVYALIDPRTSQPFYIGKGKGERCQAHVREWRTGKGGCNGRKLARIGEIVRAGLEVRVDVLEKDLTEAAAYKAERAKIREFGGTTKLTNSSHGQQSDLEMALFQIEDALSRLRPPEAWEAYFPLLRGRPVTNEDREMRRDHIQWMTGMRDELRQKLHAHGAE